MSNPLYSMFNNSANNMNGFASALNRLKQTFTGNPQQQVQNMLNSGKITQEQYNNAVRRAQEIMKLMR